jgi:hypothetical protein
MQADAGALLNIALITLCFDIAAEKLQYKIKSSTEHQTVSGTRA